MPNRPPLAAAREHATKTLIAKYADEHQSYVDEYLGRKGWHQEEVTRHRWVNAPATAEGGK
jgi:hypothetical protein